MKKRVAFFVILILLFAHVPVISAEELLVGGDFELPERDTLLWNGTIDENAAFDGKFGIQVSNSYGEIDEDGAVTHILDYNGDVYLDEGRFYNVSLCVLNPITDDDTLPKAEVSLATGSRSAVITVTDVGCNWSEVSTVFMAPRSGKYSFSFIFDRGDEYFGVFVDSIRIKEEIIEPSSLGIIGPEIVQIPPIGNNSYNFYPVVYDSNGAEISYFSSDISVYDALPYGVTFDERRNILTVSSDADSGAGFILQCEPPSEFPNLERAFLDVKLSDNLLYNSSFDDGADGWAIYSSSEITSGGELMLYADEADIYGMCASLATESPIYLESDVMYVFRANVKSEADFAQSSVYANNLVQSDNGTVTVYIVDIGGGEYESVVAAFTPEVSGMYEVEVRLCAQSERPIYIDDISLSSEEREATFVSVRAPGSIASSNVKYSLPYSVSVADQSGLAMENESFSVFLSPENSGVLLDEDNSLIVISPDAKRGEYTIRAESDSHPGISGSISFVIGDERIADGGFENSEIGQFWAALPPSQMAIYDANGSNVALLYGENDYSIVYTNSYMHLTQGETYILSSSLSPAIEDAAFVMTAFIMNAFDGENLPVCQRTVTKTTEIYELFTADIDINGRLMMYFEPARGGDPVAAVIDNVKITDAVVSALGVKINGTPRVGENLRGEYTYVNNMIDDIKYNTSATRWYISSSYRGPYAPIYSPGGDRITVTPQMAGQYLMFEVIPVCGYTGLSGKTVRSAPVKIEDESAVEESILIPVEPVSGIFSPFIDIDDCWAKGDIESLYSVGVINGRSRTVFSPNDNVTRAEFAAMLIRAFSLLPTQYCGGFKDVSPTAWYADVIETAVREGFTVGVSSNEFAPDDLISREQMALMLTRAYYKAGGAAPLNLSLTFSDRADISSWAMIGVKDAYNLGIVQGVSLTEFEPKRSATRAEAAAMIVRMLRRIQ